MLPFDTKVLQKSSYYISTFVDLFDRLVRILSPFLNKRNGLQFAGINCNPDKKMRRSIFICQKSTQWKNIKSIRWNVNTSINLSKYLIEWAWKIRWTFTKISYSERLPRSEKWPLNQFELSPLIVFFFIHRKQGNEKERFYRSLKIREMNDDGLSRNH